MFFHHQMLRKNYSLKKNKEWTNKNRNKKKNILYLIISFDVDNIALVFFLNFKKVQYFY